MIDKETRREITLVVSQAIRQALEEADERWLTAEELCKRFQCFTPTWLKNHGDLLDRTLITMVDDKGREHRSKQWVYPQRKIQSMIANNKLHFTANSKSNG
jgi:hypothetical protein